jgi:hypothetical protein
MKNGDSGISNFILLKVVDNLSLSLGVNCVILPAHSVCKESIKPSN